VSGLLTPTRVLTEQRPAFFAGGLLFPRLDPGFRRGDDGRTLKAEGYPGLDRGVGGIRRSGESRNPGASLCRVS
jgi:hypothetical protein